MLQKSDERQVSTTLDNIRDDHRERYIWVSERLQKTDVVLDAGCGVGYGSHLLAEAVASVHAIDVSAEVIDFARRYWERDNITYDVHDIHFLTVPALCKFDAVIAMEIIEHMIEPRLFLLRAREVLVPTGKLYLSVPNEKIVPHTIDLNPYHIRHFTISEITDLLSECGYCLKAYYGQDAKEILPGTDGRFLIVEAVLEKQNEEIKSQLSELSNEAVTTGAQLIVARANVLSKAKKDINSLKRRLDEAIEISKKISSPSNGQDASLISLINILGSKIQSMEDALASDVRHRMHMLEVSERNARDALSSAQWQIIRLEDEKRNLAAEVKRVDERRNDFALDVSRLQMENAAIREALSAARSDLECFGLAQENLFEQKALLAEVSRQLEDRKASIQTHERTISDQALLIDSLLRQIQALESANISFTKAHESSVQSFESKLQSLQLALQEKEQGQEKGEQDIKKLHQYLAELEKQLNQKELQVAECEETISEQAQSIDSLLSKVQSLKSDYTGLISEQESNIRGFQSTIQSLQSALKENHKIRETDSSLVKALKQQLATIEEQIYQKEILIGEHEKQLHSSKRQLEKAQNDLKASHSEEHKAQKLVNAANMSKEQAFAKLIAISTENDVLRKSNELLVRKLEESNCNLVMRSSESQLSKEPPSLAYMWRKLKHHRFYGPFIGRAIRNSLGLRRHRKPVRL